MPAPIPFQFIKELRLLKKKLNGSDQIMRLRLPTPGWGLSHQTPALLLPPTITTLPSSSSFLTYTGNTFYCPKKYLQ